MESKEKATLTGLVLLAAFNGSDCLQVKLLDTATTDAMQNFIVEVGQRGYVADWRTLEYRAFKLGEEIPVSIQWGPVIKLG